MTLPTDPLEPIILADGTKIDPVSGKVIKERKAPAFVEVPSGTQAQALVSKTRCTIAELPVPTQQMNVISLVVFYTMYGLLPQDIAIATGMTVDQVERIKELDAYRQIFDSLVQSIQEFEADTVRGFFQKKAMKAAQKIVDLAEDEDGALGFAAAKDVLDRAGHRPADVVQHNHSMEGTLHIEYKRKESINDLPLIDVTPKEIL